MSRAAFARPGVLLLLALALVGCPFLAALTTGMIATVSGHTAVATDAIWFVKVLFVPSLILLAAAVVANRDALSRTGS